MRRSRSASRRSAAQRVRARVFGRRWLLVLSIMGVAVLAAALTPAAGKPRYRATAVFELRRTGSGADIQRIMETRLLALRRRVFRRYPGNVTVIATPGGPRVQVMVVARTATVAISSANNYTADLLSDDIGTNREALIRRKEVLEARVLKLAPDSPLRGSLQREIDGVTRRVITDSDFAAATGASRIGRSDRLTASLEALAIGLLIGVAALALLGRVDKRRSGRVPPGDLIE